MRTLAIAIVAALALTACNAPPTSAPPSEAPMAGAPPSDDNTSAPLEPPPPPQESTMAEAPMSEAPGDPSQDMQAAPAGPETRSIARNGPVATPVIVEIDRTQERRAANGGSAVVLFSDAAAASYRNTVTCVNVWNLMDTATTQEVRIGVRKAADGTVEALRPLYWLSRTPPPSTEQTCAQRMARYDYARAKTIRDKYGLDGAGPYFVVARTDEKAAAVIDLTGKTDREIADLVQYFRDGFAFQNDIWDPARNDPVRKRALLTSFFGARFRESLVASLGFIANPAARAGCRLGDLRDAPCT